MANVWRNVDWVTMESLRLLTNMLEVGSNFYTGYTKEFTREFPVGGSVQVRLPQRYVIREGLEWTPQPIEQRTTQIVIDKPFGIDFNWDDVEKALNLQRDRKAISKEYLQGPMAFIKQEIDSRAAQFAYLNSPNVAGELQVTPSTFPGPGFEATSGAALQQMTELACPPDGTKNMIVTPKVRNNAAAGGAQLFNPTNEISRQYRRGVIGEQGGFDWYTSMSLYEHTAGVWQSAVTVSGAGQQGSTLSIAATVGDTFKRGDIIAIDDVNAANPMTRRNTGRLRTFVVDQDYTATGSNDAIQIYPAIDGPGSQYQNVTALPAHGAALTLWPGTNTPNGKTGFQGLAIHPLAFALVGIPLAKPKGSSFEVVSSQRDPKTGIEVRLIKAFDPKLAQWITRFDVQIGFGRLHADACSVRVQC